MSVSITPKTHARLNQLIGVELTDGEALEAFSRVAISVAEEPGGSSTAKLISELGSAAALAAHAFDGATHSAEASGLRSPFAAIATAAELGHTLLTPETPGWPARLNDLGDRAPMVLWARGDTSLLASASVCLTGSRAGTAYGEKAAADLTANLGGLAPVNGGAYGIDAVVLRTALERGIPSIIVQASGLDRVYPSGHATLYDRVAARGLIVTEHAPGVAPTRWRFLRRNALLAAITSATVVVEAGARSGTMSVAGSAIELGRPIGAVPHPLATTTGEGPHRLIREHGATLVTTGADIASLVQASA